MDEEDEFVLIVQLGPLEKLTLFSMAYILT